jgi:hypothetical protein
MIITFLTLGALASASDMGGPFFRSESLLSLNWFSQDMSFPAARIMEEIQIEFPRSDWTEAKVDALRNHVAAASSVPTWLHETLVAHVNEAKRPFSYDDPRVTEKILTAAATRGIVWTRAHLAKYIAQQWITYCVDLLVYLPGFSVCGPSPDGRTWELSTNSRQMMILEMSFAVYHNKPELKDLLPSDLV